MIDALSPLDNALVVVGILMLGCAAFLRIDAWRAEGCQRAGGKAADPMSNRSLIAFLIGYPLLMLGGSIYTRFGGLGLLWYATLVNGLALLALATWWGCPRRKR